MKKALMTLALACMATASFGFISVNWGAIRLYDSDDKTIATQNENISQILWELVYTTSDKLVTANPELLTDVADITKTNVKYRDGDTLLATRLWDAGEDASKSTNIVLKLAGSTDTTTLKFDPSKGKLSVTKDGVYSSESYTGGSVYASVFRFMNDGSVYWDCTGLTELTTPTSDPMLTATSVGTWLKDGAFMTKVLREAPTEVPEPATMSLLGLGALAMVIRRKLRK